MEKIKIKTATDSGKIYNNKSLISIVTEDGRMGSSYEQIFLDKVGQEVECEVKPAKEFNGTQQYYFNLPKQTTSGFPKKDWAFEKRKSALELSITSIKLTANTVTTENIIALADKYLEYFNRK